MKSALRAKNLWWIFLEVLSLLVRMDRFTPRPAGVDNDLVQQHSAHCSSHSRLRNQSVSLSKLDTISLPPWDGHSRSGTWTSAQYVKSTDHLRGDAYSTLKTLLIVNTSV